MKDEGRLEWVREWFKNHQAKFLSWPECPLQLLEWRDKSGSGINLIKYVLHSKNGVLMVFGDLGDAIYQWHPGDGGTTWEFIADCSLDYFAGKCLASEDGRGYPEWNAKCAIARLAEHFKDAEEEDKNENEKEKKENVEILEQAEYRASSQGEWVEYMKELNDDKKLGSDAWEWAYDAGTIINLRCMGHLEGVKMAVAQRDKEKNNGQIPDQV